MSLKEKVLLFGRGMVYQRKKERLFENYEVAAVLDNAVPSRWESAVWESSAVNPAESTAREESGVIVMNPAELAGHPEFGKSSDIPIVLLSYALGDMYRQLRELGVSQKRIRFGPMIEPYNTFENMLFSDGGELVFEEEEIFYQDQKWNLHIKTDPSNLEKLTDVLKGTPLYRRSEDVVNGLPLTPLDDTYGMNRGTPIDRYYIEQFLTSHKKYICGTVMEIGDREYTKKFGGNRVTDSLILDVEKENLKNRQIKGNFATGEGLLEESIDCLICTQTLPFIYDLCSAADNIVRILKRGGTALITAAGISQIIQYEKLHYGHFWSFTEQSLRRLFEENADVEFVDAVTYGNVKSSAAFLYGISCEELTQEELDFHDPNYQLIVAVVVKKKGGNGADDEDLAYDSAGNQ